MIRKIILVSIVAFFASCNNSNNKAAMADNSDSKCSAECKAKESSGIMSCSLTTPELQKRKETVLASLKSQVKEKRELKNGYAFKFNGSDQVVDELTEFIKTERTCCNFFTFNLSISGDKSEAWLELTGQQGVKDVITNELGL